MFSRTELSGPLLGTESLFIYFFKSCKLIIVLCVGLLQNYFLFIHKI